MLRHSRDKTRENLLAAWVTLRDAAPVGPIRGEEHHREMLELLDALQSDSSNRHLSHVSDLIEVVATLIEAYEEARFVSPEAEPRDVLRLLMEQNGLKQADLKEEIGTQSVVSEILNGKREINARQARALAGRFGVSPGAFL